MTLITPITTKLMKQVKIVVIEYPSASKSAVYGFLEVFHLANLICRELKAPIELSATVENLENLKHATFVEVIVLPPSISDDFYTKKCKILYEYLDSMQKQGTTLAAACVGAYILASGGFLDNRFCTTHWRLAKEFENSFPEAKLNTNSIIVNEGNIITAGGRMAWLDLAFEIISIFCPPTVRSHLSKEMVIDIGHREQKFYQQFKPKIDHGDELVLDVQAHIDHNYSESITISDLADKFYVSSRTLQRRFQKSLDMTVIEYIQKTRLLKACQHIELSRKSISEIAYSVGYENVNAFRKIFIREYGLTPRDYRRRFAI